MRVNEIFDSIDGEGLRTGELTTFIRFSGCNIRCKYCDTEYALKGTDGKEMMSADIIKRIKEIGNKNITITGGEPLLQPYLLDLLRELPNHSINIETNGTLDIEPYTALNNVIITMDYKTISSGENNKMMLDNLKHLRGTDCLKIVMEESDEEDIIQLLNHNDIKSYIYLSPIFNRYEPVKMVDFLKRLRKIGIDTSKTRVQVQLHKIIWKPDERGV